MTIRVSPIEALESNYIWMIHDDHHAFLVDPGCGRAAKAALTRHGLELCGILITHHHHDHIGGIADLVETSSVPVWGPKDERIPEITILVQDGDQIELPKIQLCFTVIATPGHTRSHIAYVNDTMIFSGDTLFSLGCGRLFEGTPSQMLNSLDRLAQCNRSALIYCGHEYTESNGHFASQIEPHNEALARRCADVKALRAKGLPTLPVSLADELASNPFLRTREPSVLLAAKQHDQSCGSTATEVFATLRQWKDKT